MFFIEPFILQLAVKFAPGSTPSLPTITSPFISAVDLMFNNSKASSLPKNFPSISMF